MIAVVTGATGCLGLNLTQRLLKEGYDVIALGRNPALGHVLSQLGATFIPVELHDLKTLQFWCQKAHVIFHTAAHSSPWGKYQDFYTANVTGTEHVIASTPENTRIIYVSTPSIYFDFTEKHHIQENAPLPKKPANTYVKTKLMAESIIDKAHLERDLKVITLRPRAIFGPYDRAIFPRLLNAYTKGVLPMVGAGKNIIDITYVENVVESLLLAATASSACYGKKYNITNDEPRTLIDIVSTLFMYLQKPLKIKHIPYAVAKPLAKCFESIHHLLRLNQEPRLTAYSAGVLALGQTLNISAAQQDLGYKPTVSIDQGLKQYAAWYIS